MWNTARSFAVALAIGLGAMAIVGDIPGNPRAGAVCCLLVGIAGERLLAWLFLWNLADESPADACLAAAVQQARRRFLRLLGRDHR